MNKLLNFLTNITNKIQLFIFKTSDILFIIFMTIFIIYFSYLIID